MTFRDSLERMAEIYGGIAIFSVDPGSTTHRAGVRSGDILVAVNGRRVRKLSDYAPARKLRDELLELVVVRGGRTMTLWAGDARVPAPLATPSDLTCAWRGAA